MAGNGRGPVVVEGLDEMLRDLRKAGAAIEDLKRVNDQIASAVSGDAHSEVPVRSGKLRASIRPSSTAKAAAVKAGNAGVAYAGPIHFGWSTRGLGAGRTHQRSKGSRTFNTLRRAVNRENRRPTANPFLYRALDHRIDDIMALEDKHVAGIARAFEAGTI